MTFGLVPSRCSRAAFTLFEVVLAIAIGLIMVAIFVPSINGVFKEQELTKTFEEFDNFVRDAQRKSIAERRTYVLVFEEDAIVLEPEEPTEDESAGATMRLPYAEGAEITLARPAALEKEVPMEWYFWRSGTCEPALVSYKSDLGHWLVKYDPLTARSTLLEQGTDAP